MILSALHRLYGLPPGPVTDELLDQAVADATPESDDLDWKSSLPPTKSLAASDFPKDVAEMANTGGGTIIYGVTETEKKATARVDVGSLTENHERALHAVLITAVSPPIFGVEVHTVGKEGNQAIVVTVPPSTDPPHLVFRDQFFGAPVRNNADTVWLKEPQIEAAYRARLEGQRRAATALNQLWEDARDGLRPDANARVILAAKPRLPYVPTARPSRQDAAGLIERARNFGDWLTNNPQLTGLHPLHWVEQYNLRPGFRQWIAFSAPGTEPWRTSRAELHHDGSVSLVSTLGGRKVRADEFNPPNVVQARDIESTVADFMGLLLAVNEGVGINEFEVQVGLVWQVGSPLRMQWFDRHHQLNTNQIAPLYSRFIPIVRTVTTEVSDEEYHQQAYDLAEDCVNQGGLHDVPTMLLGQPWRKDRL